MRALLVLAAACVVCAGERAESRSRYMFYRRMSGAGGAAASQRRLFGARVAPRQAWGAACALLDRFWSTRCSGAVLAPRWALTAAHCISSRLAFVKYNSHHPSSKEGDVAPVHYLYRHPGYRVVQEDLGRGMDVTLLHHDVGLVRTRDDMRLAAPPHHSLMSGMTLYDQHFLDDKTVDVLGFGRTDRLRQGEELLVAELVVGPCERGEWYHVVCGRAAQGARLAGVCSGDSGGPVVFRGVQVAVTSMGPMECADGPPSPGTAVTSVFTALHQYAPLINSTIYETNEALRMTRVPTTERPPRGAAPPCTCLYSVCLVVPFLMSKLETLLR